MCVLCDLRTSEWVSAPREFASATRRFTSIRPISPSGWQRTSLACDVWINLCHIVCTNVQLDTEDHSQSAVQSVLIHIINVMRRWFDPLYIYTSNPFHAVKCPLRPTVKYTISYSVADHTPGKQPIVVAFACRRNAVGCFVGGEISVGSLFWWERCVWWTFCEKLYVTAVHSFPRTML